MFGSFILTRLRLARLKKKLEPMEKPWGSPKRRRILSSINPGREKPDIKMASDRPSSPHNYHDRAASGGFHLGTTTILMMANTVGTNLQSSDSSPIIDHQELTTMRALAAVCIRHMYRAPKPQFVATVGRRPGCVHVLHLLRATTKRHQIHSRPLPWMRRPPSASLSSTPWLTMRAPRTGKASMDSRFIAGLAIASV